AEDGIRDRTVTGVQTCALPISLALARQSDGAFDITVGPFVALWRSARRTGRLPNRAQLDSAARRVGWRKVHADSATRSIRLDTEIGRASCRERAECGGSACRLQ